METYICLCVFTEAGAALMVRYTWHHHTVVALLLVRLLPFRVQPFVHYSSPAIADSSVAELGVVVNVCLDTGLVIQVCDTPFTGSVSHLIRPFLLSWLASEEVLHKDTRFPLFYLKNVQ